MELRQELMPPQLEENKVAQLTQLATEIVNCLDSGQDYNSLIESFNSLVSRRYEISDFDGAAGSMRMEEFARIALTSDPTCVVDVTRKEYFEIIRRVASAQYSERDTSYWISLLQRCLGCPMVSDFIFHDDLTPEQILERAQPYKPIAL